MDIERPFSGNLRKLLETLLMQLQLPANLRMSGSRLIAICFQPATCAMKKLILALIAMTSISAHADKAAEMYQAGITAVKEGDVQAAETAFRQALKLRPGYADARYQLIELKNQRSAIVARGRAKKLSQYTIDQVDFDKAELSEALAALAVLVEEKSEKKFSPNFIIQDPASQLGERTVSLQVKGVPATGVLDMLVKQAGGTVKFEEHAIVIKPATKAAPASP
jgi:tetratricopeptide (TPR) repeat protein